MVYIEREDNMEKQRTIQEYVPGKQVTLAHLIANPDKDMCIKLGLKRRETVWSLSAVGVGSLTGAAPSTRGPEWTNLWCTGCDASRIAG